MSDYYSALVSKKIFPKLDNLADRKLRGWAKRREKGNINKDKYWRTVGERNWCVSTEIGFE
ncbi:group II intron maturase-specific domain-containing protein [Microcoleus sp. Pol11C2]|uniref:group II intron maturase-specific domain-containing protein n=1 Tax=Microcoleus sp. Pol11C2 TaxID=3055389 RepID=UPI002FD0F10D